MMRHIGITLALIAAILFISGCNGDIKSLRVTATAYTSRVIETDSSPFVAAWGDKLKPGVKSIAVSGDLEELGLTHGSYVWIDGLPGRYKVLDRMHSRWEKKIDIYMGRKLDSAIQWGQKEVVIRWVTD